MPAAPTTRLDPQDVPQLLLGRYRVLEERGHGGFGSVSVCWDPRLMRRVAIKVIPLRPDLPASRPGAHRRGGRADQADPAAGPAGAPEALRRRQADALLRAALSETRTASMLAHPNIVSMLDFEADDSSAYIIMEYVEGASLAELMDATDDGLLTSDEAAAVAEGVGDALSYAHDNGVLHLDIKPDNILVDGSGRVRVADFGMASLSSATGYAGATGGTVGYMPPEQIEGGQVDVRTDVFALAALMYEALTGTRPFAAATAQESLSLILGTLADPCALNQDVPPVAADALLEALEPDPDARPAGVEPFVAALRSGLGSPRAGRKSLATLVADVTNDEQDPGDQGRADEEGAADPYADWAGDERGVLSRIESRAALWALRACCGAGEGLLAGVAGAVLSSGGAGAAAPDASAGFPGATALVAGAIAAAVGCAAPQLGGAVALAALAAACAARGLWAGLALALASAVLWWALVARRAPGASGAPFLGAVAGGAGGPVPTLVCGMAMPPAAAAAGALSAFVCALCASALAGQGELGRVTLAGLASADAAASRAALATLVENPATLFTLLGWAGGAALLSALANQGGYLRCYLGCLASTGLLGALRATTARLGWAAPLSTSDAALLATALLVMCAIVFLFGTPRSMAAQGSGVAAAPGPGREEQ